MPALEIIVYKNKDAETWDSAQYICKSIYYGLEISGPTKESVMNEVKGIILCSIGQWQSIPNKIEFVIIEREDNASC